MSCKSPQAEGTVRAPPTHTHHLTLLSGVMVIQASPGLCSRDVKEVPYCLESDLASRKLLSRHSTSYLPGPPYLPLQLPIWFSSASESPVTSG